MNGFEVKSLPGKGRALIATKAFQINDVIFEEEPFVSCQFSWNAAYKYLACDHCMRPLETTEENVRRLANNELINLPFPEHCPTSKWINQFTCCPNCFVKYCSEDCRMEALKKYHMASCLGVFRTDDTHPINVLNETWKKMHYPPETGTIMILERLLAMYKQSRNKEEFLEILKSFQSKTVNEELMIFHKLLGPDFRIQLTQLYEAFCKAFNSAEYAMFTTADAFKSLLVLFGTNSQGIGTSAYAGWVKRVKELSVPSHIKKNLDQFIDDLYEKIHEFAGEFLDNEGCGLYLLQSKINHSCAPNAECTFPYSNDILVMKCIGRNIQPGEEITISYLTECWLERSRHTRQKQLKDNYLFICKCPKCEEESCEPDETSEEESEDEEMNID